MFETESLGGTLARPLTPAVREGSELALFVWVPSLPQVLGFKLAKKEDLGDCVVVGLLAVEELHRVKRYYNDEVNKFKCNDAFAIKKNK